MRKTLGGVLKLSCRVCFFHRLKPLWAATAATGTESLPQLDCNLPPEMPWNYFFGLPLWFLFLCFESLEFLSRGFRGRGGRGGAILGGWEQTCSSTSLSPPPRPHSLSFDCPPPQDLPWWSRLGCTLFLRGGGLRLRLCVGMVVV